MTEPPRPRRNGDIVNGYRWDGRQWVPLTSGQATYPRPQPGPAMSGYRTQQPQSPPAPGPGWAPPGRTAASPARAGGWTPAPAGGWTPAGSRVAATRGGKPTWLLWALVALAAIVVLGVVVVDGSPGGSDDADVKAGVAVIARGCSAFAGATGSGPGVSDVRPDGAVAQYVESWPTNPFTGRPMAPGTQPGDYRFSTAIRMPGGQYRGYVWGVLSNGETYSVEFEY